MQFEQAREFILEKLRTELPRYLSYHDVNHTIEVVNASEVLASTDHISDEELDLLRTAALFHDTGFLEMYKGHEEVSCKVARMYLPQFDYTEEQIERICTLVMATRLPQDPKDKLARFLCDADLSYLGTDRYAAKAEDLYQERYAVGLIQGRREWTHEQIKFLHNKHYFTPEAENLFGSELKRNLATIQRELHAHSSPSVHKEFHLYDFILILLGVVFAGFALKGFLVPNNFFDGGVTGISLLIHDITKFDLAYVILLANLPFIIIGFYTVGFRFALKTLVTIILLGFSLSLLPMITITSDHLLVSIFGGFFLGVGIGLTMRAGCAIDGIEVLALYTWRKTSFSISEIILALNIIIFSIAAIKYGPESALYSMLTYFTASKTIDYVIEGVEAYTGVTIISGKSEIIKERMVNELGRGITVYKGERGFLPGKFEVHAEVDIIFTVITRLELRRLINLVNDIDPKAFLFASTVKEASGGILKRRHIH
jgi:uncharacterized membrane-anchored protein YitT (DUF2179 family)/HD superfamily phosphodiesterase